MRRQGKTKEGKKVRRMLTRRTAAARQMSSGFLAFEAQANANAARGARAKDALTWECGMKAQV